MHLRRLMVLQILVVLLQIPVVPLQILVARKKIPAVLRLLSQNINQSNRNSDSLTGSAL
ncbi:hypothetical protein C1752_04068 [Acaryochloris thomasi RCC1774]|uniref:Uncharacterized protein n=1 Tax=Acaryochloris thomasi RCC1774 TaxID=1764569 RepID=A0A2W1JPW7_9CYAN|nr:hypothetical protein C1752_04068 [Acaryochloris thomasi RCC1774]